MKKNLKRNNLAKCYVLSFLVVCCLNVKAQYKLEKLWETDSVINLPESVLPDVKAGVLYTSVMGNNPNDKDGIGGVAKLSLDGKVIDSEWIKGLNAPKGLTRVGNIMYIADLSDVVVVDMINGKVKLKIPIENAKFLNDITADQKGIVYVSDSQTKRIYKIQNNIPALYLDSINGVNGLKAIANELYIVSGKNILKADANKKLVKVTELPNGGDGLEPIGNGDFLFTSWGGYVYYVYAGGRSDLLLDTHLEKKNAADLGYDPIKQILYIPTFWKKSVAAYQLRKF